MGRVVDPLRFSDEAVQRRHKYAWVPYSRGSHFQPWIDSTYRRFSPAKLFRLR